MPNGRGGYQREERPTVIDEVASRLSSLPNMNSLTADILVEDAEKIGDCLANQIRLKTSQIRKFLDAVNRIRAESEGREGYDYRTEVVLLKPKIAYAAGRHNEVKYLMTVLEPCMSKVTNSSDFQQYSRLVEAIVAYHRYHGGRD